jgi:hypothetical protein
VDSSKPHQHYKLDKALYGFKQAPHYWYSCLSLKLQALRFTPSKAGISLLIYKKNYVATFLLVYIDDIIITSSSPAAIDALLLDLKTDFALKDLGSIHYFLGIEVKQLSNGILLSQEKYVTDILHRVGMLACKPVHTPMSTSERLSSYNGDRLGPDDISKYRSVVSVLQYLSLTRTDLTFPLIRCVNICSH